MAFTNAGLSENDGLLVSVLLGIALFAVGAVGGVVWLVRSGPMRISKLAGPQP